MEIVTSNMFAWYFTPHTVEKKDKLEKGTYEHFMFSHNIIVNKKTTSHIIGHLEELIEPLPFKIENISRAKLNFMPQYPVYKNKYKYNTPHIDSPEKHKVALIHLNDSDGPVYLFNKKLKVIKKINHEKGKVLMFNGDTIHTGSHPINTKYRISININYR